MEKPANESNVNVKVWNDRVGLRLAHIKEMRDSAVWIVALSSPGFLGALSQASNLYEASRIQPLTGYVFAAMEIVFLASIIVGLMVHLVMTKATAHVMSYDKHAAWAMERLVVAETLNKGSDEDVLKARSEAELAKADIEISQRWFSGYNQLMKRPLATKGVAVQAGLVMCGYALFVLLIATSDFFQLLKS
jgi:hypothetical protein